LCIGYISPDQLAGEGVGGRGESRIHHFSHAPPIAPVPPAPPTSGPTDIPSPRMRPTPPSTAAQPCRSRPQPPRPGLLPSRPRTFSAPLLTRWPSCGPFLVSSLSCSWTKSVQFLYCFCPVLNLQPAQTPPFLAQNQSNERPIDVAQKTPGRVLPGREAPLTLALSPGERGADGCTARPWTLFMADRRTPAATPAGCR
jgi:hypothetical protein